jgi:DNA-binding MarR family transcriptional regulator
MLMNKLMQGYSPVETDQKLNRTQWKALLILSHAKKPTMSQMSRSLNMEKGSLTSVIDGLIERGLVARIEDPADRRKVLLELSEQATKTVRVGEKNIEIHIMKKLDSLGGNAAETLSQALRAIITIAEGIEG